MIENWRLQNFREKRTVEPKNIPPADRMSKEGSKKRTAEPKNIECRMSKEGSKKRTAEPKNIECRMSKEGILPVVSFCSVSNGLFYKKD
jgi:hypothetical protein